MWSQAVLSAEGNPVDDLNPTYHEPDELNPTDHSRDSSGLRPGMYQDSSDTTGANSAVTSSRVSTGSGEGDSSVDDEEGAEKSGGVTVGDNPVFKRIPVSRAEKLDLRELLNGPIAGILNVVDDAGEESLVAFLHEVEGKDELSAVDVGRLYAKMDELFEYVKSLTAQEEEGSAVAAKKEKARDEIVQIALKDFDGDAKAMWDGFQSSLGSVIEVFNTDIVPHVVPGEAGQQLVDAVSALKDAIASVGLINNSVREVFQDLTDQEKEHAKIKNDHEQKKKVARRKIILRKIRNVIFALVAVGILVAVNFYLPWLIPALKVTATVLTIGSLLIRCMAVKGGCFQISETEDGYAVTTTPELTKKMRPHRADGEDENPGEHDENINVSNLFKDLHEALGALGS